MLVAPSSSLLNRNPYLPLADTTKSAITRRPSPTIATKFRRQPPRADSSRGADLGTWTALKLDAQQQRGLAKQKPQEQEQQLSGVDVLRALQRASAQKIKKKHARGRERVAEKGSSGGEREGGGGGVAKGESSVRALCINGEWGARLDDLEKQLHELMHS